MKRGRARLGTTPKKIGFNNFWQDGIIPWDWIIDETRELELISTWDIAGGFDVLAGIAPTPTPAASPASSNPTQIGALY